MNGKHKFKNTGFKFEECPESFIKEVNYNFDLVNLCPPIKDIYLENSFNHPESKYIRVSIEPNYDGQRQSNVNQ